VTVRRIGGVSVWGTGAVATSAGTVWLATAGGPRGNADRVGELYRFEPPSAVAKPVAALGGSPVALAVAGTWLWIANGMLQGTPEAGANQVWMLQVASGRRVAVYDLTNVAGLAASGSTAWALTGTAFSASATVEVLTRGQITAGTRLDAGPIFTIPGDTALALCQGSLYAVTEPPAANRVIVTEIPVGKAALRHHWVLPGGGTGDVACGPDGVVVLVDGTGWWIIQRSRLRPQGPFPPENAQAAVTDGNRVWLLSGTGTNSGVAVYLWPDGTEVAAYTSLPQLSATWNPPLVVGPGRVWLVAGDGRLYEASLTP
jgi:hypothetical protein